MVTRNADSSHRQGDGGMTSNPNVSIDQLRSRAGNLVFKSGPLFISSKGIGWTSWKKRWFILTRTSLVFFRSDPGGLPQKGSEVNLTLGGIDLNNSGSVVVRADKKLLTVLFPDGRDGRAFTLKAETSEEMYEWKTALENALAQAPSAALAMGQNGIFQNDATAAFEGSFEQWRGRRNVKSLVVGRPVLLALEDIDGCPSFLEKALRFIEQHGVRVEGILRQAADVDDVECRIQAYEQGKDEFSPDEDVHVVADCVKHALRELPSSPVPASCCTSLLEAFRNSHGSRVDAMRAAISDTFPDPNRRLLERVLKMMRTVASHKSENRMSTSAVAACMAPLLLRPLLAGDCEVVNELDGVGDGSLQLLQAAAAANYAQAIVILLLEEFNNIFLAEGSCSPELYSELEGTGSDESTDDEILQNDGYCDGRNDLELETGCNPECALSGTPCEGDDNRGNNVDDDKGSESLDSEPEAPKLCEDFEANGKLLEEIYTPLDQHDNLQSRCNLQSQSEKHSAVPTAESHESLEDSAAAINPRLRETESTNKPTTLTPSSCVTKLLDKSNESVPSVKHQYIRRHTSARKNLSMESIEYPAEDETAIQRFEITKADLQNKIAKEVKENSILQASLERRRQALHQRRSALEQDVVRLQEQLQKERELRATLEAGLNMPLGQLSMLSTMDSKTRADVKEIALAEADVMNLKQKVADLHLQLNQQRQLNFGSVCESCCQPQSAFSCQPTSSDSSLFIRRAQENDVQIAASVHIHEGLPRSEDAFHGTMSKRNVMQGSQPSSNKETSQMQQAVATTQNSNKSEVATAGSSTELLTVGHQASSKKQNGKGELGAVPTQSTLTKLTARLNFLKERRSHLVKELQILGPTKASYSEGPLHSPPSRTNPRRLIT